MNIQALMKQAQSLQKDMMKAKEEIDNTLFTGSNSFVTVKVNGKKKVLDIKIDTDSVDKDDIEMLQDILMVALNNAFSEVDKVTEQKMSKYANIPGLF
ncbi:MAG: YbaB/EbfC family nucleoid-associated protein [Bacilli bacterium]|jgi:DNA-binding protein, ybaB/ebfC family|nr:YbaB/EbfC family nucleoid-associated protein [Clostridium sp.]MDY6015465.1 YbaB/EbfC family nucleoid-associated protein [Bacilli bacterium]